ncbi:DNA primase [Neobittarella massiliensis]|uniref:DNA primase n=1 Tax=Neobittarella massiliensis (ex Bilen et al. 2018) TaxID=2041842 RepID=A0A8J6IML5_9FIRM|nr:DNA primase [Neobittarella massiliensis]MBC3516479.1 DNA primase [Neobittarella massiliensis]
MLPESFLTELKFRNDIEDVVGSYVDLKRAGSNTVKGLCPFHSEKTPSFVVYRDTQSYYCFGCGAGGDVITFIKSAENLDYIEAVKFLAQRAGMQMPEQGVDDSMGKLKLRILEANRAAARWFYAALFSPAGKQGLDYLLGRGLSIETIKHFGLGFAPSSWNALRDALRKKGFSDGDLLAADLVARSSKGSVYDKFRGRVMFPIIDLRGNVIGFGGRNMGDEKPKYLNTAETPAFHKNRNLFALNFAKRQKDRAYILAEGYMDVIAMHQAGFCTAVATLGTAIGDHQARLIAQYADTITIAYDADEAGQIATKRAIGILAPTGIKARVLHIPRQEAKDPDEYIKKYGNLRFERLLQNARGSTEYELQRAETGHDLKEPAGRAGYIKDAAVVVAALPTPAERDIYAGVVAERAGATKQGVLEQVEQLRRQHYRKQKKKERSELLSSAIDYRDKINPQAAKNPLANTAEEFLIAALLRDVAFGRRIYPQLAECDFVTDFNRRVYSLLKGAFDAGLTGDLSYLAQLLTDQELARVTRIIAETAPLHIDIEEIDQKIGLLKKESSRPDSETIAHTPDADWAEMMRQLRQQKK